MSKETMDILIALKQDYLKSLYGVTNEEDIPLSELLTHEDVKAETKEPIK